MKKTTLLVLSIFLWLVACKTAGDQKQTGLKYPETKKTDHVDTYHGVEVPDPYQWLEDDLSEETAQWVKVENEVTFGYLEKIPFRTALQDRIEQLMDYEKISAPFREGRYEYFYKNDGLQDHSVLYRTPIDQTGSGTEVFLDPNNFSKDDTTAPSPCDKASNWPPTYMPLPRIIWG